MSAFTDFLEQNIRDHFKRDTQLPLEDTYLGVSTSDPSDTGSTAGEPTGAWYSRQQVYQTTTKTPYWTDATGGTGFELNSAVTFPTATTTPGTVSHFFIVDSTTGGSNNMLFHTTVNTTKQIKNNDQVKFSAGEAEFTFQ